MNPAIFDIIIFAAIAVFLFFKLRSVLGEVDEDEKDQAKKTIRAKPVKAQGNKHGAGSAGEKLSRLNPQNGPGLWPSTLPDFKLVTNATAHNELLQVNTIAPDFDPYHFLQGSKAAFGMIIEAFSKGDKKTLQNLLSPDLYEDYALAIDQRIKDGQIWESEIVEINSALISNAELEKNIATITVDFESVDKITARDKEGNFIDDQDGHEETNKNSWSFTRDLKSKKHIWTLTDTHSMGDE